MKYKEWLKEWLELYAKQSIKQRTYEQYSDVVRRRLIPNLGEYDMDELDARVIQRYIVKLSESGNTKNGKGLSPNSVNSIILVIHSSLSMAYILGLTRVNCADKIKRPKKIEKNVESFSQEEQKRIEQAVLQDKRPKMIGVVLCLYTGLRIGELLALEWNDVDFSKGELYVTKTCYDSKDEFGKYSRINSTPKTKTSRRIIPLPKQIMPLLKDTKRKITQST